VGADGAPGAVGPQGAKGDVGADGAPGAVGPQGAKGDVGADGAPGAVGPQGAKGDVGADGAPGAVGPQGAKGDVGAAGATGPQGQGGITQGTGVVTVTGAGTSTSPYIIAATTAHTLSSTANTLTSTVNGITVTTPLVNTNTLTATNGSLISTVNGIATAPPVSVLIDANNGLTVASGKVQLGGTLSVATTIVTTGTNTLALSGLQTGAATDNIVVASTGGVLKTVPLSTLAAIEPWNVQNTTTPATANSQNIYQLGAVAIGQNKFFGNGTGTAGTPGAGNEMLSVNGTIRTASSVYADYVFEDYFEGESKIKSDYKFQTLKEVADFIKTNRHLPGVTSITDKKVIKVPGGYSFDLTELSVQSLEKLEELYLHVIDQQKQIEAKDKEVEGLRKSQQAMSERLEKLEKLLLNKDENK
nr:hypothetical protein [Mucilaginibacter sp. SP1R1]